MNQQHRTAVALVVLGGLFTLAAGVIGRKDVPLPLGPTPPPSPPAHLGLHVWSIPGCPGCVSLHEELRKPEAQKALERFGVVEEQGGGLAAVRWSIHGYPTMIVTDGERELGRHEGSMGAAALAAWLDGFR